jgi:dTDP-glucose 4,6-dehydratase
MTSKTPKNKTIFITGAAGFIGSNVLEHLYNKYPKYSFIVLDALTYAGNLKNIPENIQHDPRFSFVYGDIRNSTIVDSLVAQSDIVIHFAAETHVTRSIHDNVKFFETDVLGTQAVANAVHHHRGRVKHFLHISTCEVYGAATKKKMDENHLLQPHSPYAAAKAGADRLVYSYYITYKTPITILRPFNIFGPRQHLEKAIPRFITSALLNEPLTVHGNGKAERDYMYVDDVARAVDTLIHAPLEKTVGEVFNIGSGKAVSMYDVAKKITKHMNIPESQIKFVGERPGQVSTFACDYKKINTLFGWKPSVKLSEGLDKTIKWYQDNKNIWEDQIWLRQVPIAVADGKIEMH